VGVLDDAIREHLDLKKRRGADPGEVEKQAAEALGPARREPAAEPAVEDVPAEAGEEQAVEDVPAAEAPIQLAEDLAPPPPAPEPIGEEEPIPDEEPPGAEVTQLHPVDEAIEPDEVPAEEQMVAPPAGEPDDSPLDFPTDKGDNDALWFEQPPRRDLDFDD
jgi:hypothetical protein